MDQNIQLSRPGAGRQRTSQGAIPNAGSVPGVTSLSYDNSNSREEGAVHGSVQASGNQRSIGRGLMTGARILEQQRQREERAAAEREKEEVRGAHTMYVAAYNLMLRSVTSMQDRLENLERAPS